MTATLEPFEAYCAAHPTCCRFIQVVPAERSLGPAPRFIFGTLPSYLAAEMFGELDLDAAGCFTVQDGRLAADAVVLHERAALFTRRLNHPEYHVRSVLACGAGSLPVRRIRAQAAAIYGPGYPVYGHWLVDFLPRLYLLQQAGHDLARLLFVMPFDMPDFAFQLLLMVGIAEEQILRHDPRIEVVQFDELVVPTLLRTASRLHPYFARATRTWTTRLIQACALPTPRRIFLSRNGILGARSLDNREAIERLAAEAGFAVVRPETLSLAAQATLLRGATQVIGEYGSALHATVFSNPGLVCCALRGSSHAPGFVQSGIAQALGQTMAYVLGPSDEFAVDYNFAIDIGDFTQALVCLETLA